MRPDGEGRAQLAQLGTGLLNADSVTTTSSITNGHVIRRDAATASAVVHAPCGRRTWWWASWPCPHCGGSHLSRARSEGDLLGQRRSGCGRLVMLTAGTSG